MVGLVFIEQLLNLDLVQVHALSLVKGAFVPIKPKPVHAVQDGFVGRVGRTLPISILDSQNELTAMVARVQPAKQRRACPSDM